MTLFGNNWNLWRLHVLAVVLLISSCVGDPWPEPDTMENESPDPGSSDGDADADVDDDYESSDEEAGDTDNGIDAGGDADADSETEAGATDVEADSDQDSAESIIEDEFAHLATHIFVSAPDRDGWVTAVGLAGTIPAGRSVQCFVGNTIIVPTIGLERGFAFRTPALSGDTLNCVVQLETENVAAVALPIIGDDVEINWGAFIGTGLGAVGVNDGYVLLSGSGIVLEPSSFVIGVNVSRFSAAGSPTVCVDTGCRFDLMMPGRLTDELEIFMVRGDGRATPAASVPVL